MTEENHTESGGVPLRDVVTGVVEELAPEERPLLDALSGFDDATALRRLTARDDGDQSLAFGVDAATALVALIVWISLDEMVRLIIDSAVGRVAKPKRRRRRWLFGRRKPADPVMIPRLTQSQLTQVGQAVFRTARDAGLPDERGEQIAASVVGRLVLLPPQAEP